MHLGDILSDQEAKRDILKGKVEHMTIIIWYVSVRTQQSKTMTNSNTW